MKELYTKPELMLDKFNAVDVLTASGEVDGHGGEVVEGDDD